MNHESTGRQRPLFHTGPRWQQLDEQLQEQLVVRLAEICHVIVATLVDQEESDDNRND